MDKNKFTEETVTEPNIQLGPSASVLKQIELARSTNSDYTTNSSLDRYSSEREFLLREEQADESLIQFGPPQKEGEIGRLGKYRLLQLLGRGGMGAVYLAIDSKLKRKVALKVILPKAAANPISRKRFLREAQAAAQISNDHVVKIFEAEEIEGVPFMAMEYLEGESLEQFLESKKHISIPKVIRVIREAAEGLASAHKLGLIHRDVKPSNIWLESPKGRVKLLDFGLVRKGNDNTKITNSGIVLGTPAFMSPEQAKGYNDIDQRSDLFSLGSILYRLLTGELPFKGTVRYWF